MALPNVEDLLKRFDQLQEMRSTWDGHWTEVAELCWPQADEFFDAQRTGGEKRTQKQFDMTAALALNKFSSIYQSMNAPRSQRFQRLVASDEDLQKLSHVQEWLERLTKKLFKMRERPKSNFFGALEEGAKSIGAFGNQALWSEWDPKSGLFKYKHMHIGQVFVDVDHHGLIDTMYRRWRMSARAAAKMWGENALPDKIRIALDKAPHTEFPFLRVVIPREGADLASPGPTGRPWGQRDISIDDKAPIGPEGGYHEFPLAYGRFSLNPTEKYGRGPAMMVLPDIKTLQEQEKTILRSAHKAADPPLLVNDDGVLGAGANTIDLAPGGLNYGGVDSNGRQMLQPLVSGARPEITLEMQEKKRETINTAFWVTIFQILVDHPGAQTATEVLERAQEKGQLIAPSIGRNQDDVMGPMTEREVNHILRTEPEMLDDIPGELVEAAGEYDIQYDTPATRLARSEELLGIARTVEIGAPFIEADPSTLDVLDGEEVLRVAAEITGAPTRVLRSAEDVAELRSAREERAMIERAAELAPGVAKAAKDVKEAGLGA